MKKCYAPAALRPSLFATPKPLLLFFTLLLTGLLPRALKAQTTYDFSTAASIQKISPSDYYYMKAEFTSGGVVYVISGGINGSYSNSANNGDNNTASLKKDAANQVNATIKRKDGKAFLFYGLWVKYTNGSYGSGTWFTMDYKFGCTTVKTFSNNTQNATATPYDAAGVTVTELSLNFRYLINFYLDNFVTGTVGNLPPVITPADCNDQVKSISIPSKTKEITTILATDDNNDPLTYSLSGADASLMTIDANGKLAFNAVPALTPPGDANKDGIYTVVVTVSDGKGGTDSQTLNISLIDADIVFAGCDGFTFVDAAYLKHNPMLDVVQGGITRYGYSTSQAFFAANYYDIYIQWDAATSKWLITTDDEWYGTTIMYSSTKNTAPYPPDVAGGGWVGNTNLPDGYGSCGALRTLSGEVCGKPAALTANTQAQDVKGTSATLTGTVNDAGVPTTVSFDYGTSASLVSFQTVSAAPALLSAGSGETSVSATVSGLQPNTLYYFRVKGTNSMGTTAGDIKSFSTASTLPVTLLQLDARKETNGTVSVNWSTASETNNRYFEVERSADGNRFETIGRVEGSKNGDLGARYTFVDPAPIAGINYYRLVQADLDGSRKSLGIRKVEVAKGAGVRVYPNPVQNNQVWIYSGATTSEILSFNLINLSGKTIRSGRLTSTATVVNTTGLARGIYVLDISNGQKIKLDIR